MTQTVNGARVLIIGLGGLGCPASLVLARAGVGALTLVDPDRVDATNLHRQLWHRAEDVGRHKVDSAAEKLKARFPAVSVEAQVERVTEQNAAALFSAHDLVIDGSDGVDAKFLFSDTAARLRVPLIYGGVLRMQGQVMGVFPGGPCLRCLFETPPSGDDVPTCAQAGVLGSMAGIIGALQGVVAHAWLSGERPRPGAAALQTFDGATLKARRLEIHRRRDCAACSGAAIAWPGQLERSATGAGACRR